ncbi:MAG: M12 family metallo-peptidase [Xanthomonadales bacterium]|nr:M12 family metallo-peptidase [Xanthomonadales bacterium]
MTMRALNSNDQMNVAIGNSDIRNTRVRIVGVEEVAYNENNGVTPHTTRWYGYRMFLRDSPFVELRRSAHQADLVVMFIHDNAGSYCGLAYVQRPDCDQDDPVSVGGCDVGNAYDDFAFSVVHVGCAQANAIYAHEVGHQFGAEHQPAYAYAGIGSFVWSYAHHVNQVARDLMAYQNPCTGGCPMQLHYSNPFVNFFGGSGPPTGSFSPESIVDPRYRYSARTLQYLAQGVANFRGMTAPADRILFSGFEPK